MRKAKLIKRSEVVEGERARKNILMRKSNPLKTVNVAVERVENRRNYYEDPRKAFAALFAQPQTQ